MLRPILRNAGIRPGALLRALRGWHRYAADRDAFRRMEGSGSMPWGRELPMLMEWDDSSGTLGGYFYQDLTVAGWIHEAVPQRHVDVGSRLDGFIGHLAAFREVEVLDIRPQPLPVPNVKFHQLDLMRPLPEEWLACTDSLSCLHTIEHFGLGRYGDALDPDGYLKGLEQLAKLVRPGGTFYLSTLVGRERIEFNAHRVYSPRTLMSWFSDGWEIRRTALIDDQLKLTTEEGGCALLEAECETGVGIVAARKVR
jgi:hypothetical protein